MAQVNIFLLLPETEPSNHWMRSTETEFYEVDAYERLIQELKQIANSVAIEKYEGFYDASNLSNFLELYEALDDCYPSAPKRLLRGVLAGNAFTNWREGALQAAEHEYQIFNQTILDNSFCEIAERKKRVADDHYALLNHQACVIKSMIAVTIDRESTLDIDNLKDEAEVAGWFSRNRIPPRNFNINPKHGENRQDIRVIRNEIISPLRCSMEHAQALLHSAIGETERELFNLDPDYDEILVFRYEGPTPQNMYHGYHVPKDSEEVPDAIRKKLTNRLFLRSTKAISAEDASHNTG